jgi:long-chain acyl-CoA synthetase
MKSQAEKRPWLSIYPPDYDPDLRPRASCALEHLREAVAIRGEDVAIRYFHGTLTFRELDETSDAFACALLDLGLKRGDRVGLYLQNVPQFVIAQYGIWKAGGIVVPLNPMYKERELDYYFQDAGLKVFVALEALYSDVGRAVCERAGVREVITTSELDLLPEGMPLPSLLHGSERLKGLDTLDFCHLLERYMGRKPPPVSLNSEDVAYLTYTSGTTGPPKGAMNTHGNVVFNSEVYRHCLRLGPGDAILAAAPLFHVTGMIAHIGAAMASAIPLVLFYRFDTGLALELVERYDITCTVGSITVFIALMNDPTIRERRLSSLRKVYSGGAPVIPAVVNQFEELTGAYIHNVYGLTESTSPTHLVPLGVRAPVDPNTGALSIGVPIPGHMAKVVDLEDPHRELPPMEVGELVVKGPAIVAGYWEKPQETANAIRDGWLHTGDVGTMDEKGWFYILDRKKDMIIASGFKVWPREVEDVLYLHPAVREAAVVGVPDPYRGETVKAFVALKDGYEGKVKEEKLIAFCKERMAAYKYPRQVEFVSEIPKTATGKFLRRELRKS